MAASGIPASVCGDKWQLSHKCLSLGENGVSSHRPPPRPPSWPGHSESRLPSTEKSTKTRDRGRESERTRSLERAADGGGVGSRQPTEGRVSPFARARPPGSPHLLAPTCGLAPLAWDPSCGGEPGSLSFPILGEAGPNRLPPARDRRPWSCGSDRLTVPWGPVVTSMCVCFGGGEGGRGEGS
ncbi:unnamed protein product [Rangifer tarandus platyrhynchus]|uniref:Uncharacterized protein n=1 Tax=Rangifer tarandus platyrhynchus TaxID=3082113 RepID=A0AC59YE05_RANTA